MKYKNKGVEDTSDIGNCNIFMKQKISVINEMKRNKIVLKLKVCDQENLH